MNNRIIFHSPVRYAIAFVLGLAISAIYLVNTTFSVLRAYADGLLTGGVVLVLIGLLVLVAFFGAFDMFSYAFLRMIKANRERYHDLYEYTEVKKEKRSANRFVFMPYIMTGIVFILISLILYIIA